MAQRYVSDDLLHCVGRALEDDDQRYDLLINIVRSGLLTRPPRKGFAGFRMNMYVDVCSNELLDSQIICFCDIPFPDLAVHMAKYSRFGLSFPKTFLIRQGANPVFYIARRSMLPANVWPQSKPIIRSKHYKDPYDVQPAAPDPVTRCDYFNAAAALYNSEYTYRFAITPMPDQQTNEFQRVADLNQFLTFQFFAFLKFFDPDLTDEDPDNYYMEREWRILGDVVFQQADIQRLVIPAAYKDRVTADLPNFKGAISLV
jgi:hypothetical protein